MDGIGLTRTHYNRAHQATFTEEKSEVRANSSKAFTAVKEHPDKFPAMYWLSKVYTTCTKQDPLNDILSSEIHLTLMTSITSQHVRVMNTPLHPTFIQSKWGLQGDTFFSDFRSKTWIVVSR